MTNRKRRESQPVNRTDLVELNANVLCITATPKQVDVSVSSFVPMNADTLDAKLMSLVLEGKRNQKRGSCRISLSCRSEITAQKLIATLQAIITEVEKNGLPQTTTNMSREHFQLLEEAQRDAHKATAYLNMLAANAPLFAFELAERWMRSREEADDE